MSRPPASRWRGAAGEAQREAADEALADLAGRALHFLASGFAVLGCVCLVILLAAQVTR